MHYAGDEKGSSSGCVKRQEPLIPVAKSAKLETMVLSLSRLFYALPLMDSLGLLVCIRYSPGGSF